MDKPKYYTKNKYGISIVKCCASCAHKLCDSRVRYCMIGEGSVPSDFLCSNWKMSAGLDNAGKGGGMTKKKQYLEYSVEALFAENKRMIDAVNARTAYTRKSIAEIRADYDKKHGGIYWDM